MAMRCRARCGNGIFRGVLPLAMAATLAFFGLWSNAHPFPVSDDKSGLPVGSELDEDDIYNPREVFHSEAIGGHKSYFSNLGDLAFNSPYVLGAVAQKAGISCGSCHVNGATNPKLYIPGLSSHPGNFDTTSALFNPKTDNGVLDPVTIPSLRGARYLAPYGHDGRTASLRDFVRNVVVSEFGGTEPSPEILDAIVIYIEDIDFLPNPGLDKTGRLKPTAMAAELRGEALFSKPFAHDPSLSCAGCHVASAAFVDHRQHDVGSGGFYKTPTLLNADFNASYFHDGRFDNYGQVVDHFDRVFDLGLSARDRADLVSYLTAVGDGVRPEYHLTGANVLADTNDFASVLDIAIAQHDTEVVTLTVESVSDMLRDIADHYPDPTDNEVTGGATERQTARTMIAALTGLLHRIDGDVSAGKFDEAAGEYLNYRKLAFAAAPMALQAAEPWSLYESAQHAAHIEALRKALAEKGDGTH